MPRHSTPLTSKEEAFVGHYLVHGNGAEAVRQAGYNCKDPRGMAHDILRRAHIKAAIDEARKLRAKRLKITADRVLVETFELATLDHAEAVKDGALPQKTRALALLHDHLGLKAPTKSEHSGPDGGPIPIAIGTWADLVQSLGNGAGDEDDDADHT
jgi:phage terminase small subunit